MRVLAFVNLRAGQADAGLYDYLRDLGAAGAEVTLRFLGTDASLLKLAADARGFDRVIAVGGDGTVSSVCYALRDTGVPILAYPAGTANLLALNLKMPLAPESLAALTLKGESIPIDIGELRFPGAGPDGGDRIDGFAVMAGAGFDARIMERAADLKGSIGVAAYIVGALQNLTPTVSRFSLELDGEHIETEGIAALLVNFAKLQFDLSVTHASDPSDGVFEVVILRTRNVAELLPAVWAAILDRTTGQHPGRSGGLEIHSARTMRIDAHPPLPLQYDGEVVPSTTPFEARVLPQAARLIVPEAYLAERRS